MPTPTEMIDHIIPAIQQTGSLDDLFWVPWNHEPLCMMHHRVKCEKDQWIRDNRHRILSRIDIDQPVSEVRHQLLLATEVWQEWIDLRDYRVFTRESVNRSHQ